MPVRGFLSHLDLNVSSVAASSAFYAVLLEALGFERNHDSVEPGRATWMLVTDGGARFEIEIRSPRGPAQSSTHVRDDPGIDHLAFHAESEADVDAVHKTLIDAGYAVAEPPRRYDYTPGYYAVAVDDPDGIRLEVVFDPVTNP